MHMRAEYCIGGKDQLIMRFYEYSNVTVVSFTFAFMMAQQVQGHEGRNQGSGHMQKQPYTSCMPVRLMHERRKEDSSDLRDGGSVGLEGNKMEILLPFFTTAVYSRVSVINFAADVSLQLAQVVDGQGPGQDLASTADQIVDQGTNRREVTTVRLHVSVVHQPSFSRSAPRFNPRVRVRAMCI